MSRILAAIVLVAVLAVGGGIIATTAYQAGASSVVTTAAGTTGGTVVTPVVVPAYGYGWWHPFGFVGGFFGFLFFLFFLFLVFGLIRAIVWGGRGRRGWYGPGWGPGGPEAARAHWESKAHRTFDAWHQSAHGGPSATPPVTPAAGPPAGTGSNPPSDQTPGG
jgi:hypothetical protein